MSDYCLTYFLVKFDINNFDYDDFASQLNLDLQLLKRFGTDETIEIGRNEVFDIDINVMIRKSIKDLIGKEDILLKLKNKYNLEYYIERVPWLVANTEKPRQILSLDNDIIAFMYKAQVSDDLDYYIE